jgi:HSP20 family protein
MTLIKFNKPKSIFERNFDDLVSDFFGNSFDTPLMTSFDNKLGAVNIKENDKKYELEVSVPGLTKDDIDVEIKDNLIKISSTVEHSEDNTNEGYTRREFRKSSFSRSFTLPEDINTNDINGEVKDGILTININKQEVVEEKPKKLRLN